MSNKLLSVIIPVYNVRPYLPQCLDSIIHQTYKNMEIIIVNDGSTDGSDEIIQEYSEKDSRILVINKKNGGLGAARNTGIEIASGDYITFVDSDDWIELTTYEEAIDLLERTGADISEFQFRRVYGEEGAVVQDNDEYVVLRDKTDIARRYFMRDGIEVTAWNKVYQRDIFSDIRFPDTYMASEDIEPSYLCYQKAETVCTTQKVFYDYRIRQNSITQASFTKNSYGTWLYTREVCEKGRMQYPELQYEIDTFEVKQLIDTYRKMIHEGYEGEEKKEAREFFKTYNGRLKHNPYLSLKEKIFVALTARKLETIPDNLMYSISKRKELNKKQELNVCAAKPSQSLSRYIIRNNF